jgi:hypothetical protein
MSQILSLIKPLDEMSDEELRQHLINVRRRREVERPAAKAKVIKEKEKKNKPKMSAAEKLLSSLSPEELEALMKELSQ